MALDIGDTPVPVVSNIRNLYVVAMDSTGQLFRIDISRFLVESGPVVYDGGPSIDAPIDTTLDDGLAPDTPPDTIVEGGTSNG